MKPVMRWFGSKKSQANKIVSFFPEEIDTYYELFLGGVVFSEICLLVIKM